jgi:hypothetical protein
MHLLIPHASALGDAAAPALRQLDLPRLTELIALLPAHTDDLAGIPVTPTTTSVATPAATPAAAPTASPDSAHDEAEYRLSPPHEAALARLAGWPGRDGNWPLAAWWAQQDGLAPTTLAGPAASTAPAPGLARLTPVHWHVGAEQISLLDPRQLELDANESRGLLQAVLPSFEAVGWRMSWGAPLRWYAAHADLHGLASASLDRVIGRNIELWLPRTPEARLLRRLQVEVQMLLHEHPINEAREARRLPTVNSFWLSGGGPLTAAALPADLSIDTRLSEPLLGGDWAAWCAAWQALDAGPISELLVRARTGAPVQLTLCGERQARHWRSTNQAPPAWRRHLKRWLGAKPVAVRAVLEQL